MRAHHPPSDLRWRDLALVQWRDHVDHADSHTHKEAPSKKHANVDRTSLDCSGDNTQDGSDLDRASSAHGIGKPCLENTAYETACNVVSMISVRYKLTAAAVLISLRTASKQAISRASDP